jgi:hypothetical protein
MHAEDATPVIPFDINAEKMPFNYTGTDIARLYALLLKKAPLKKGEFETTTEYEKKVADAVTGDIYAFKMNEQSAWGGLRIHPYDADAQKLKIDLETTWLSKYTTEDYRASFIIKELDISSESYVGSNAFGATRLVTHYRATQFGIALVNQREFGKSNYDDNKYNLNIKTPLTSIRKVTIEIDMMPDKAKELKENIGVLLLCQPSLCKSNIKSFLKEGNDLIFESSDLSEATIDRPSSHLYKRKYINVQILEVWIYDILTGEVLLKNRLKRSNDETQRTQT